MTFNEIEKEFDEINNWALDAGHQGMDAVRETFKSFLKQSFIKYLKDEVYACQQYKSFYNPIGDEFNRGKHKAMDDRIEFLQAQIKELSNNA